MKVFRPALLAALLSVLIPLLSGSASVLAEDVPGRKWRVIYVEGGPHAIYVQTLAGLARGLEGFDLIAPDQAPFDLAALGDTRTLWLKLSQMAGSGRLEFLSDGYYSANWDEKKRIEIKQAILNRLKNDRDVDLILAFGTWAGQDLVTSEHQTPVINIAAADPVGDGISDSPHDSGLDHAHVMVSEHRTASQIRLFHDLFKFRRLGVPINRAAGGQSSTIGLETIEALAGELNFQVESCETDLEISDSDLAFQNLKACLNTLSAKSDAIFLTVNDGMVDDKMPEIMEPILQARIPSFSQSGAHETKLGVLMSLGHDNFDDIGSFEAGIIEAILGGARPGGVNQIYEAPLTLALNIKTAQNIGWNPPFEVLVAVDELYQNYGDLK